jgi:hypothetical protein
MVQILRISSGAIVWSLHFAAIYGITALACARSVPQVIPWTIGIATAFAFAAAAALIVLGLRAAGFAGWMTAAVAGLALIAIAWEAVPVFVVPACA